MDCHAAANSARRPATATEYAGAHHSKEVALEVVDVVVVVAVVVVAVVAAAAEIAAVGGEMVGPRMGSFSMM